MTRKLSRVLSPYLLFFSAIVTLIAGFGMVVGMHGWETVLWAIGVCLVVGAAIFTYCEVRRLAGISRSNEELAREEDEADRRVQHGVIVQPPTADPYPHHEDHHESQGFDQGQLTSRIPSPTPLVRDSLHSRKPAAK